jgi:RNA polymerase sigma-70 factor (ECF subfamily)
MRLLNESDLTIRILRGDRAAFSLVFRHYYADLVLFAHTFLKDKEAAEETVQDTFVRLWESRESIVITTSLKSFLLKSIQNRCIDQLRHSKMRNLYENSIISHSSLVENDTENYLLFSELQEDLQKAIIKLPPELSTVFKMNRYEGKTYGEIAETLHVSVRTIEVRMGKALAFLRENLKDYLITAFIIAGIFSA